MRVLIVHSDLLGGGIERVVVTLARALPVEEKAVCYCPSNHPEPPRKFLDELRASGVELLRIQPSATSLAYPFRLARAIRAYRPDLVHFHGTLVGIVAGFLRPFFPRRVAFVYTQHPRHSTDSPKLQRLARYAFRRLDHVVCGSRAVREELLAMPRLRLDPQRVSVIYNGIDLTPFRRLLSPSERQSLRAELGVSEPERLIGSVGLLWPIKGYHILLPAFAHLVQQYPRARLALIGKGEQEEELKTLAHQLGLEEKVRFLGWRGDVPRLLQAFDLYVQPSLSEGFPLAPIEAAAAGLPVVATQVGGLGEVLEDRRQALFVPPGDEEALRAALIELVNDPDLARRLGHAARDKVHAELSAEAMAQRHVKLYTSLLKGKPR